MLDIILQLGSPHILPIKPILLSRPCHSITSPILLRPRITDGLMRDEIEKNELANFKHLAYVHMSKEISWYLPNDIFGGLPKQNISTINVETIQKDFGLYVHTLAKIFEHLGKRKPTAIPKNQTINLTTGQEHSAQPNSSAMPKEDFSTDI